MDQYFLLIVFEIKRMVIFIFFFGEKHSETNEQDEDSYQFGEVFLNLWQLMNYSKIPFQKKCIWEGNLVAYQQYLPILGLLLCPCPSHCGSPPCSPAPPHPRTEAPLMSKHHPSAGLLHSCCHHCFQVILWQAIKNEGSGTWAPFLAHWLWFLTRSLSILIALCF